MTSYINEIGINTLDLLIERQMEQSQRKIIVFVILFLV